MIILIAGTLAANNNATGILNKPLYIGILAVASVLTYLFLRTKCSSRIDVALALLASGCFVWGIWTIERPQLLAGGYWEGFGARVAVAVIVLALLFGAALRPRHFPLPVQIGLGFLVVFVCLCDVLGAIRTADYMPYVNNNLNEINDMLGPLAGRVPDSTFIPQYTAVYGWLFLPLKSVLSPAAIVGVMSIFLTALGFATVALAVWIVKRLLGSKGLLLPLALVVPLTYVTSRSTGDVSSIASLLQELPIRLLAGFTVIALGVNDLVLLFRGVFRRRQMLAIGVVCGVAAWISQDFGLAAAGVYGTLVVVATRQPHRWRAFGIWFAGFLAGAASYPLFLAAIGSPINLSLLGGYIKLFGSGLGSAPIQVPGPVLVVMPIVVCSAAVGWALVATRRRSEALADPVLDLITITLTFVGTWSAVCLVYYVNRAYAAGQLQTMLLPCAVCVAALLSIATHQERLRTLWSTRPNDRTWADYRRTLTMTPIGIMVCLCFAAVLLTPNPITAARILLHPSAADGFTTFDLPQVIAAVDIAKTYTSSKPGTLTYLGESFNYVALATRVPSNAVLFPWSLSGGNILTQGVTQIECQYLANHHSVWMVLSTDGVSAFGTNACGIYHTIRVPGIAYGQLQELS